LRPRPLLRQGLTGSIDALRGQGAVGWQIKWHVSLTFDTEGALSRLISVWLCVRVDVPGSGSAKLAVGSKDRHQTVA